MIYATIIDLAGAATGGWDELAQRACRDARVSGALLQAVASDTSVAAWSAEAATLAEKGLATLFDQLARASRYVDNYVAARYPDGLSADQVATSDLASVTAALALRRTYGTTVPEELLKGTAWADKYLRDLAEGKISLGRSDAQAVEPETAFAFSPRAVTDASLKGFA